MVFFIKNDWGWYFVDGFDSYLNLIVYCEIYFYFVDVYQYVNDVLDYGLGFEIFLFGSWCVVYCYLSDFCLIFVYYFFDGLLF